MSEERQSKTQMNDELITELEMEAVQQLIQLSDEDSNSDNNVCTCKRNRRRWEDEEVNPRLNDDITLEKKIQEVFRSKKQKRYRSLVNIYTETRPVNA